LRQHKRRFGRNRDCDCAFGSNASAQDCYLEEEARRIAANIAKAPYGADRMTNPDALMAIYYVVLSGVLVFTLGYFAGWRHAKRRQ
jgi:hypothetical protein